MAGTRSEGGSVIIRRKKEARRQAIIAELEALRREFSDPLDQGFIGDMILYATVGRDRMNLGDDYVAKTRRQLEEMAGWKVAL